MPPIHGYVCMKCKKEYEVIYSTFSAVDKDEPKASCEFCKSKRKKRLPPSGTAHILKGSGWARDGYGK